VTIEATTAGSTANYTSFCGDTTAAPSSPNVVYALTLTASGDLSLAITASMGSALVPALDMRTDCSTPDYCLTAPAFFDEELAAGTYYVIVTGSPGTSGAFTLTATLTAPDCGNGVLDPGETCDPGTNPPANDGCGAPGTGDQCQVIPAPAGEDTCPGQAVAVSAGTTVLTASQGMSTYGFVDDYLGSCGGGTQLASATAGESDGTGGVDRVFQVTPAQSGTLTVSVGYETDGVTSICGENMNLAACWFSALYARTACDDGATEQACTLGYNESGIDPSTISFAVAAGTPYWVFVDGYNSQNYCYGPFNLVLSLQ
jgi:hypothetical protein